MMEFKAADMETSIGILTKGNIKNSSGMSLKCPWWKFIANLATCTQKSNGEVRNNYKTYMEEK